MPKYVMSLDLAGPTRHNALFRPTQTSFEIVIQATHMRNPGGAWSVARDLCHHGGPATSPEGTTFHIEPKTYTVYRCRIADANTRHGTTPGETEYNSGATMIAPYSDPERPENGHIYQYINRAISKLDKKNSDSAVADDRAYLALTSKSEGLVRDSIAVELYHACPDCFVAREFPIGGNQRADVAVVLNHTPHKLIELKYWYTFDLYKKPKQVMQSVKDDIDRTTDVVGSDATFIILCALHPKECANHDVMHPLFKYSGNYSTTYRKAGSAEAVLEKAMQNFKAETDGFIPKDLSWSERRVHLGRAYGYGVDLLTWIIHPPFRDTVS